MTEKTPAIPEIVGIAREDGPAPLGNSSNRVLRSVYLFDERGSLVNRDAWVPENVKKGDRLVWVQQSTDFTSLRAHDYPEVAVYQLTPEQRGTAMARVHGISHRNKTAGLELLGFLQKGMPQYLNEIRIGKGEMLPLGIQVGDYLALSEEVPGTYYILDVPPGLRDGYEEWMEDAEAEDAEEKIPSNHELTEILLYQLSTSNRDEVLGGVLDGIAATGQPHLSSGAIYSLKGALEYSAPRSEWEVGELMHEVEDLLQLLEERFEEAAEKYPNVLKQLQRQAHSFSTVVTKTEMASIIEAHKATEEKAGSTSEADMLKELNQRFNQLMPAEREAFVAHVKEKGLVSHTVVRIFLPEDFGAPRASLFMTLQCIRTGEWPRPMKDTTPVEEPSEMEKLLEEMGEELRTLRPPYRRNAIAKLHKKELIRATDHEALRHGAAPHRGMFETEAQIKEAHRAVKESRRSQDVLDACELFKKLPRGKRIAFGKYIFRTGLCSHQRVNILFYEDFTDPGTDLAEVLRLLRDGFDPDAGVVEAEVAEGQVVVAGEMVVLKDGKAEPAVEDKKKDPDEYYEGLTDEEREKAATYQGGPLLFRFNKALGAAKQHVAEHVVSILRDEGVLANFGFSGVHLRGTFYPRHFRQDLTLDQVRRLEVALTSDSVDEIFSEEEVEAAAKHGYEANLKLADAETVKKINVLYFRLTEEGCAALFAFLKETHHLRDTSLDKLRDQMGRTFKVTDFWAPWDADSVLRKLQRMTGEEMSKADVTGCDSITRLNSMYSRLSEADRVRFENWLLSLAVKEDSFIPVHGVHEITRARLFVKRDFPNGEVFKQVVLKLEELTHPLHPLKPLPGGLPNFLGKYEVPQDPPVEMRVVGEGGVKRTGDSPPTDFTKKSGEYIPYKSPSVNEEQATSATQWVKDQIQKERERRLHTFVDPLPSGEQEEEDSDYGEPAAMKLLREVREKRTLKGELGDMDRFKKENNVKIWTPILFLDIDGTIRRGKAELGRFVNDPEDVEVFPEVSPLLELYKEFGWRIVALDNQGGVSMGHMTEEQLRANLVETDRQCKGLLDVIKFCPTYRHHPNERVARSWCRKPAPGMIYLGWQELVSRYGDKERYSPVDALFVGDGTEDAKAADRGGVYNFIHASQWRTQDLETLRRQLECKKDMLEKNSRTDRHITYL